MRFGLIGAAGYIAPRHMKAIKETDNELIAALDKNDSVGIIDSYFPEASFFTETERFDRHVDMLRRGGEKIDYISICTPNYLHDAHVRLALRNDAHVICEKPLVLNPWNIDALQDMERETGKRIYSILQLRLHPSIIALKKRVDEGNKDKIYDIDLRYITSRGQWYHYSWKGDVQKSGGLATNIGVHFFDMLTWIFGDVKQNVVESSNNETISGYLELSKARIKWMLSIDYNNVPEHAKLMGKRTYRSILIDGQEIEFSDGFVDLHTESYKHILAGNGFACEETRRSIEIVAEIRRQSINK